MTLGDSRVICNLLGTKYLIEPLAGDCTKNAVGFARGDLDQGSMSMISQASYIS